MSPAGIVTMIEMPIIGILLMKGLDARWLIVLGLATIACASFWMSSLNLQVSPGQIIWPRCIQTLGAGLMLVPLNTAAYIYLPRDQVNNASGLFNLIRNEGSSVGVALSSTLVQRRIQFHHVRLSEHIHTLNPISGNWLGGMSGFFQQVGSGPVTSARQGHRMLDRLVQQQAAAMSYLDAFWVFGVLTLAIVPIFFFMKRSVSEGGEIAAH